MDGCNHSRRWSCGTSTGCHNCSQGKIIFVYRGIGNPAVSTLELVGSALTAILAIILPIIGIILVVAFIIFVLIKAGRSFFKKMKAGA